MDILLMLLVGLIAGALAGQVMKGTDFGIVGNIVVGLLGALVGGFLVKQLGFSPSGDIITSTIVAFIGAVVLIWLVGMFGGRKSRV